MRARQQEKEKEAGGSSRGREECGFALAALTPRSCRVVLQLNSESAATLREVAEGALCSTFLGSRVSMLASQTPLR
jgi:hypothetical protein